MKIISHRGNLDGRNPEQENHPFYIQTALDVGYEVEIDVWYVDGHFYLGHDSPQHRVYGSWLQEINGLLWCHAKNDAALGKMLELGLHCFWHETDRFTLTSKGIPWCYPGNFIPNGVTVVFDNNVPAPKEVLGVCTDYPVKWKCKSIGRNL